eukprot:jgi/Galph1/5471/GphlegSOOS_G4147.1
MSTYHLENPIRLSFVLFLILDISLNLDNGAIPVYLYAISEYFMLSRFSQGVLGALAPAGFALSTFLCSYLLRLYSPKAILILWFVVDELVNLQIFNQFVWLPLYLSLSMAVCTNIIFALSTNWLVFYASRLFFGLFCAIFFVYMPVWTDEFAPSGARTRWLGFIQAGAPIGVILGSVLSGLLAKHHLSWRIMFFLQACIISSGVVLLCFFPRRVLDIEDDRFYPSVVPKTPELVRSWSQETTAVVCQEKHDTCINRNQDGEASSLSNTAKRNILMNMEDSGEHSNNDRVVGTEQESSPLLMKDNKHKNTQTTPPKDWKETYQENNTSCKEFENAEFLNIPTVSSSIFVQVLSLFQRPLTCAAFQAFQFFHELSTLMSNTLWLLCCLTLAFLFFTIEGIRYWVVVYRQEVYRDPLSKVVPIFVIVSSTAPILGVLIGGYFIDRMGGYKVPETLHNSLRAVCVFGFLAAIPAWYCAVVKQDNLLIFGVLLWLIIFFGAAMVAPLTGIMVSVVALPYRSNSSAMSLLINHLFGYFAAPFVTGSISQVYGIEKGFPFVLWFGSLSLPFALFAWIYQQQQLQQRDQQAECINNNGLETLC